MKPRRRARAGAPREAASASKRGASGGESAAAPSKKPRARRRPSSTSALPESSTIELVTERQGVLGYRYRRLSIEQQGRRVNVRELRLQLDYDLQFELSTKKRDLAKVRGRRIDGAEFASLWKAIAKIAPQRLMDHYEFLDSVDPAELDDTVGADGEPIAVSTGEEGPACLTITWKMASDETPQRKRIVIDRFREPEPEAAEPRRARRFPLAALCALVDSKLKTGRTLNYRKSDVFLALEEEFASLRPRNFLNLRQFERRVLEAFGAVKDGKAIPLLEGELFSADSRVRLQALDALATIGDEAAVPAISELIYDDETQVREKARRILKALKAPRAT